MSVDLNWVAIGEDYEGFSAFGTYGSWYLIPYASNWLLKHDSPLDSNRSTPQKFSRFEDAQAHAKDQEKTWQNDGRSRD